MRIIKIAIILFFLLTWQAYAVNVYIHTTNPDIEFLLIDYNHQKTGYDPKLKKHLAEAKQLPIMNYMATSDDAIEPPVIENYTLQGAFPVNNIILDMRLIITGKKLSTSSIICTLEEDNPAKKHSQSGIKTTILDKEQISIYDVHYIPYQSIFMTKIATSNDLLADITTAQKLNLIGNSKFVSKLLQTIEKIEQDKIKYGKDDITVPLEQIIKKEYTELLNKITEKYNKPESDEFVKKEAYDVLKEDLEYIISHL